MKHKILMTLALLITAVGGAWAADTYTITFKANNKTKTIENVTLPHTFMSVNNQGNGELDLIVNDLYDQSEGWCVETPTVSGNSNVTAGLDGSYNQYITISAPFEGNATVSGSHFYNNPISSFTYTLEISVESPSVDVTLNEAKTEASFDMPTSDVTIDYELVRDMAVKMPVTIGDGKDGYHVRLKKDGDKWKLADLTNEQLMAKVKVHDAIEEKDLPFYGNDAVCDAKIYALGNDGKPTGDAITLATMAPGNYVIVVTVKEGNDYYEGKAISNTFMLYQGYEVTVGAGEYATYYKDEALYTEDENAELYTIASVTDTEAVLSDQIKVAPAKTPLLIYNKGEKDMTFILLPTEEQADAITAADQFKGTLAAKDMPASTEGEDYYVCTGKAFVWVMNEGTIAANKCWLEIIAQAAGARANTRSITGGSDTTGIDAATHDDIDGNYYDLLGRKVVKPNSKGIYIKNGKKVIKH